METKVLSFATKFEADNTFDNDRFIKLRVWVMHDNANLNGSSFSLDAIENAKHTLSNIPILANVIKKADGTYDFGGHDIAFEKNENGEFEVKYLEQPIGVIPETNNYELVEKDGKTYVVVDAFVWRDYSNKSEDLLETIEKFDVSMEVLVDEYSFTDNDLFDIIGYRYTGVTLLGSASCPAMTGAKAEVIKFSVDEISSKISEYTVELAKIFAEDEKEIPLEEDPKEDEVPEESACEDKFELTMQTKQEKLNDSLTPERVIDEDGDVVSETNYWVMDFTDSYVYVRVWDYTRSAGYADKTVRAKYDAETLTVDKDTFEEVFCQYLTQEEINLVDSARQVMEAKMTDLEAKFEQLNNEIAVLSEFKAQVDAHSHKCKIDDKLSEFEHELCNNDEFKALKEVAVTMSVDAVEKECFAIVGRNSHKAPVQNKKQKAFSFVSVENTTNERYGAYEKYFDK